MKTHAPLWFVSRSFSAEKKNQAIADVLAKTVPDRDYYLLVIGAVLLAVFGIFTDSIPVLVASMIVAPLAYPILGLGMAIVVRDGRLAARTIGMLLISFFIAIAGASFVTSFFGGLRIDPVFISFGSNLYIAVVIALIAGFIAAYGLVRSKVGGALTGIGIAVSLMPPAVATGIGLLDPKDFSSVHTLAIFLLNVAGILAGSMAVFAMFGFRKLYSKIGLARTF